MLGWFTRESCRSLGGERRREENQEGSLWVVINCPAITLQDISISIPVQCDNTSTMNAFLSDSLSIVLIATSLPFHLALQTTPKAPLPTTWKRRGRQHKQSVLDALLLIPYNHDNTKSTFHLDILGLANTVVIFCGQVPLHNPAYQSQYVRSQHQLMERGLMSMCRAHLWGTATN